MSIGWGSLPLLPLRCILDHLSMEDAFAVLSTCRHWRSGILLYEGRKETLKLQVKHLEKNLFVTRLFRKYTRKLHIYIDTCGEDLDNFMSYVLPQKLNLQWDNRHSNVSVLIMINSNACLQFFDSQKLQELVFIGPSYILQNHHAPVAKVNRIITESLLFKNMHCLQKLTLLGCEMGTVKNENARYTHKRVEYYSRPLSFDTESSLADTVLSSCNISLMGFSTLQHVILDYNQMSTETLRTLSQLTQLSQITLNIGLRRPLTSPPVDWHRARSNLHVALNIISVPHRVFPELMDNVFVEGLPLISLKVIFCRTLLTDVVQRVVRLYKGTIQELVWADAPYESPDIMDRIIKQQRDTDEITTCNINPLILLCWQCSHLRRLVVHGYWVWQYDLLGFVRLRTSLEDLEVSAIYNRQTRFSSAVCSENIVRVLARDIHRPIELDFVQQINSYTEFEWTPVSWERLHPALKPGASPSQRLDYVLHEALQSARQKL